MQVENSDIHAHKNVLACASPHLMELFSAEEVGTTSFSFTINNGENYFFVTRSQRKMAEMMAFQAID